jgi:hypothetical protein
MNAIAKRPARTVRIECTGHNEGTYFEARLDFPARLLVELQSGDFERQLAAFEKIVTQHNATDSEGAHAQHFLDVDPFGAVQEALEVWSAELGKSIQQRGQAPGA